MVRRLWGKSRAMSLPIVIPRATYGTNGAPATFHSPEKQKRKNMRIQMEPTAHLVVVDGVECRVWNAITERGSRCFVFVHRIALPDGEETQSDDQEEFDELFLGWTPTVIRAKS